MRERVRHPLALRDRLSEAQNHRCCLCGGRVDEAPPKAALGPWTATFEHIIDLGDGGADDESNLAVSHNRCNNIRNAARQERKRISRMARRARFRSTSPPNPETPKGKT